MDTTLENSQNHLSPVQQAKFYSQNQSNLPKPKERNYKSIALGIAVAAAIIGIFWFVVLRKLSHNVLSPFSGVVVDIANPKSVMNPITGVMYTEEESAVWKDWRPLAVMINNYTDARPQSGLVDADLVYEVVAEGGITRYLAFFLTNVPEKIGPVRSTREYYLVLVKELGDAMIMHIGWSPQALEAIETWPVRSLGRGGGQFWRDQTRLNAGVATEHTAYVSGKDLRELGDTLGWEGTREFTLWEFKDDSPIANVAETADPCEVLVGQCDPITVDFWYKGDYTGVFKYNSENNSYLRFTGYDAEGSPIPTEDQDTKQQVEVKNVIVQFVAETAIAGDEKNRLEYELVGSGNGLIFIDGTVYEVIWAKSGRDDRTMFYDSDGNSFKFNRGKTWISIVPDRNVEQVVY